MAALLPPLTTASTLTGDDITSISTMSGGTTEHLDTTPEHLLTTDSGDLNTIGKMNNCVPAAGIWKDLTLKTGVRETPIYSIVEGLNEKQEIYST